MEIKKTFKSDCLGQNTSIWKLCCSLVRRLNMHS